MIRLQTRGFSWKTLLGLLAMLPLGCASNKAPANGLGTADIPASKPLAAGEGFQSKAGEVAYSVREGDRAGDVIRIEKKQGDSNGEWIVTRTAQKSGKPIRVDRLRKESDGSVVLLETESRDEGVISKYDPPMVMVPVRLDPGKAFEQKFTLSIHPISKPDQLRDKGPAKHTIWLFSGKGTDLGGAQALWRTHSVLEADLKSAKVLNTTDEWLSEKGELLAEREEERATLLGIVVNQHKHFFVIVGSGAGGGAAKPQAVPDDAD